jgi:thiosulfate/3-mercaptopyruvate sulfurtransferase
MAEMSPVVSTDWLASQLDNPQVVVVDCRFQLGQPAWGYQQYLASHVPGAFYLDLERDLSAPLQKHGGRHPLPAPALLAQKLSEIGINTGKTLVVAYDDSRFAFAARLWWLLRYLGHDAAALLDGGWQAWQAGGHPTASQLPSRQPGKFTPQIRSDWMVELATVKACQDLPATILVDARAGERYRGEREPIDPIAGHIPGAVNCPWQEVTDERGFLRPLAEQKRLWTDFETAEEIIVYCGSGVTACTNLLSLELAGIKNAKLYPGGWSDWCSYLTAPDL